MAMMRVRLADLAVEPRGIADRPARLLAQLAGHELGRGARGEAARDEQQHFRSHQASPSKAGATLVVLPAPGGAISKARVSSRSAASRSGSTSSMGSRIIVRRSAAGFPR